MKTETFWRHFGRSFIERGLGAHPMRWFWVATGLTGFVAACNIGYYMWLSGMMNSPWGYVSYEERRYIEGGIEALAGAVDLQMCLALIAGLFLVAPTLACLTVTRETQNRTMDALITAPMSPLGLHNGLTFGALAKLAPWLLPPLALHVLIGVFGGIDFSTLLATVALFAVGGWAVTSLGTMFGLLMAKRAKGPMGGLAVFVLFGMAFGLPIITVFESNNEFLAMLSPAAAVIHSLVTDSNFLLSRLESSGPQIFYEGRLLGLPIQTTVMSLGILAFFGGLSTHVGARKFSDPVAPPIDHRVAIGGMVFVVSVLAMLISMELPDTSWWALDSSYLDLAEYYGREFMMAGFVLMVLSFPWLLLFSFGSIPSAAYIERARLWAATRPSDLGQRGEGASAVGQYIALAILPVGTAILMPALTAHLPMPIADAYFGTRILALLPIVWGLGAVLQVILLWRLSEQKPWQTGLATVTIFAATIAYGVYAVVCIDDSQLTMSDLSYSRDALSVMISMTILLVCVLAPFILGLLRQARRESFAAYMVQRVDACAPTEEEDVPFEWPAANPNHGARLCRLRPARHREGRSLESWLLGARGEQGPTEESWLDLKENALMAWTGSAANPTQKTTIDMVQPFNLVASIQPRSAAEGGVVTLNLTVTQKTEGGLSRIAFSVPLRRSAAFGTLPEQDQRLGRLGPRDARPVLSALRYYAEANGAALPF